MYAAYIKFNGLQEVRVPRPRPAKSSGWKTQEEAESYLEKWAIRNISENAQGRIYKMENGEKTLATTIAL